MNDLAAEKSGRNVFHALAAMGTTKQALQLLSTTPKKVSTSLLLAKDKSGCTPLHLAAYYGHVKILKVFIDAVPEACDIRDLDGNNVREALRRPNATLFGAPEDQRRFQRLVKFDKNSVEHHDFGKGPMEVWDLAMSNKSSIMVVQHSWSTNEPRSILAMINGGTTEFNLGEDFELRFIATSNIHTLAATAYRCFAWGKNRNGVLGLYSNDKMVVKPTMLDKVFVEQTPKGNTNKFSALNSSIDEHHELKDPLIGVSCCDYFSCCYSTTTLWCWGTNRGQMLNKAPLGSEVKEPEILLESNVKIRKVVCCNSVIAVLFTNNSVTFFHNDRTTKLNMGKTQALIDNMEANGDYLALQTSQGKLLKIHLKPGADLNETASIVWNPRKPKDEVISFDISENGGMIISTSSGIFRLDDGVYEFKHMKGMILTNLKADALCKSFMAVSNIDSGFSYSEGLLPINTRIINKNAHRKLPQIATYENYDLNLLVVNDKSDMKTKVQVHSYVLYARCPTLRKLIDGTHDKMIVTPGGSAVFRKYDTQTLTVHNSFLESVVAFVKSLYLEKDASSTDITNELTTATLLYKFDSLKRLITRDLGIGLWEARLANIACDVVFSIDNDDSIKVKAHSAILASCSPVLAAQLMRWSSGPIKCPALSKANVEEILKYAYTLKPDFASVSFDRRDVVQHLFELWQAADELLMHNLSYECEVALFNMINMDLVVPFLQFISLYQKNRVSRLHSALIDIVVRYLSFYIDQLSGLETDTLDAIEQRLQLVQGTQTVDTPLIESYETLKHQLDSLVAALASAKKKKKVSIIQPPPSVIGSSQGPVKSFPSAPVTNTSISVQKPKSPNSAKHGSVDPIISPDNGEKWIQTKRKPKATSCTVEKNIGKGPSPSTLMTPQLNTAVLSTAASPASTRKGPPSLLLPSSSAVTGHLSNTSHNGLRTDSLSTSTKLSSSSGLLSLPKLPKLGENSPNLGSKPRSKSSAKAMRPKINSEDRKLLRTFDSPFSLAQELEKEAKESTPWKQVPKIIQTSPSLLAKLERESRVNNRRASGGSVWGV